MSIRLEMIMKTSVRVEGIGGSELSTTMNFSKNVEKTREITISPGNSIACWQYVFKDKMKEIDFMSSSDVFADTNGEYPNNVY